MLFNSYIFILLFLPIQLIVYFAIPSNIKYKKICIILFSALFYVYGTKTYAYILMFSILLNYVFYLVIQKHNHKKWYIYVPIAMNVTLLVLFKYTDFIIRIFNAIFFTSIPALNLVQPLGISFFTFQQISFLFSAKTDKSLPFSFLDYCLYILYFPKLLMGPLIEPEEFILQFDDASKTMVSYSNLLYGLKIFSFGLFKKLILADTFAKSISWLWSYQAYQYATSLDFIILIFFYSFQIYFDFSGYSDMATGISLMMNIELPINFNSPYQATSIRQFWKRWHISLTRFFTKHIYISLGGSKKGVFKTFVNIMIVFMISGLWHGSNWNYLLWGILHGLLMILDRILSKLHMKLPRFIRLSLTFLTITSLWSLFMFDSIPQWLEVIHKILSLDSFHISNGLVETFSSPELLFIYKLFGGVQMGISVNYVCMIAFIVFSIIVIFAPKNNYENLYKLSKYDYVLSMIAFIVSVSALGHEAIFIYSNF